MKTSIFKLVVLVILAGALIWFNGNVSPMITADSAVSQLEDSDEAYLQFKMVQKIPYFLVLAWFIFGILLYLKQIRNLFKGDKKDEK
jgi:uncharacterized membrane protein